MSSLNADIAAIQAQALAAIAAARNLDELREVKISYVGDRSPIARANQSLGQVPAEERAALGKVIGNARANINQSLGHLEFRIFCKAFAESHNSDHSAPFETIFDF